MERHIGWHNTKHQKEHNLTTQANQTTLTRLQKTRISTLLEHIAHEHENTSHEIHNTPRMKDAATQTTHDAKPTLWGELGLIIWNNEHNKWQCNIQNCTTIKEKQSNITKHQEKAHMDTLKPISRTPMQRTYRNKKYPNGTLLLQHLGLRNDRYTWPTCTCPILHKNTSIHTIRAQVHDPQKYQCKCSARTLQTTQSMKA